MSITSSARRSPLRSAGCAIQLVGAMVDGLRCLPALAVLTLMLATSAGAEMATITTRADDVQMAYDKHTVSLQGNAEVIVENTEDASQRVIIRAELIEGDLTTGKFEAVGHVVLITTEATLHGASLQYDSRTSAYKLTRGAVMIAGESACGYAYGREVNCTDGVIVIEHGLFTTCSHVPPHYDIEARRLRYRLSNKQLVAQGGAVRVYGLKIPLLSQVKYDFRNDTKVLDPMPQVQYNNRDGALMLWQLLYEDPDTQIGAHSKLILTAHRGLRTSADVFGPVGNLTGHIRASYKEDVRADVDDWALIDRSPEVALERVWGTDMFGGSRLHAELAAGNFKEYEVNNRPTVYDRRAMLSMCLAGNERARHAGKGSWWWVGGREQVYDEGGDYSVLEAGVGYGAEVTDWLTGALTYSYHYTRGASPFEFDDVDIPQELAGRAWISLQQNWNLGLGGRYDLENQELRDYEVKLARTVHCLTWELKYRDLSNSFGLGVSINGLFGEVPNSEQPCRADGPPDYWKWQDAREQQQATASSSATE